MLPVPVEEGKGREGEERAAVAVNFFGGGWGAPLTAPGAACVGSRGVSWTLRVSGSESPQPDSKVGEGRSRSRRKPHGEGAGKGRERGAVCVWGQGAAARGGEGGS